jgi:hypothetical protein
VAKTVQTHQPWCDQAEHIASGKSECWRIVAEVEGVASALVESGDRIEVVILGAAGKPMWFWPKPILARVAEAVAEAIRVRDRLIAA